jgi:hypothetical protein
MTNSQIIDICREFRSLEEVIQYLSTHDLNNLWITPGTKPSPEITRKQIEQRNAAEKRKQDRIAEWRKHKKEQKEKPAVQAVQQTKPLPVFARPSTTTSWSQLTKNPAFASPPVPAPPPAKPTKTNQFVWKPPDVDHTPKTEAIPTSAITVAAETELPLSKPAKHKSQNFGRAAKAEESPISTPENKAVLQTESEQQWENLLPTPSITIPGGMSEHSSPVVESEYWILDETETWK